MARYRVTHTTAYRYETPVSASYGELHLLPRDLPGQTCTNAQLRISPTPHDQRDRCDWFGNRAAYFSVVTRHDELTVTASSEVEVHERPAEVGLFADAPWESVRDRLRDGAPLDAIEMTLDSPRVAAAPALADLARPSFPPGAGLLGAVADLAHRIHAGFAYEPGATTVRTTVAEVLDRRAGVCQDFAHLMVGALRSQGLAARYVSGYLETDPPPGRERLEGADRSHAWVSVWTGDGGWVDIDPTNDRFVGDRHITTAWGRDYGDVPPLRGVIFTPGAEHELIVRVDVVRLPPAG